MRPYLGIYCLLLACLTGCANGIQLTRKNNFLERSNISAKDTKFFSPADKKAFGDCISPTPSDCKNTLFVRGNQLNFELYNIEIKNPGQPTFTDEIEDFAYLLAGEVALDRKFTNFIRTNRHNTGSCGDVPTVHTYGTIVGDSYYGSSIYDANTTCASIYSVDVLLFNDYQDIKNGVLQGGEKADRSGLYADLYFDIQDLNAAVNNSDSLRREYFQWHPYNSWESYYNAKDIVVAVKQKYGITEQFKLPYESKQESIPESIESKLRIKGK